MSHDGVKNRCRFNGVKEPDAARVVPNLATVLPQATGKTKTVEVLILMPVEQWADPSLFGGRDAQGENG
jgi:hypothetical protein